MWGKPPHWGLQQHLLWCFTQLLSVLKLQRILFHGNVCEGVNNTSNMKLVPASAVCVCHFEIYITRLISHFNMSL